MAIVALEFNSNRVLVAACKTVGSRITSAFEVPFDTGSDEAAISRQLKSALEKKGLSRSEAIVVLSRSQTELRELDLPPVPDNELPDMVRFKAKSDFASFNDRWLIDFITLNDDPALPRRVLASAIAPNVSERIEKIIEPTGLKLKQLVLRPLSIINLFRARLSDDSVRLIINPGDHFTDIVVSKNFQPIATRSVRVSDENSIEQKNEQLLSEVRRTLASTKRQLDGKSISEVILLDAEKSNLHLIGNLNQRLKLDVEVINPFSIVSGQSSRPKSVAGDDSLQNRPWQYAPLLGCLAERPDDLSQGIDFLNPSRQIETRSDKSRYLLYGGLAGMAALLAIGFGWWTLSSQKSEIASLTDQYKQASQVNDADGVRPSVDTILSKTGKIDDWKKSSVNWLDEINAISKRFLTADEAILDSFDGVNRTSPASISFRSKVVSNDDELKLTKSLQTRPYTVTPDRAEISGDSEYPLLSIGTISLQERGQKWLKDIDDHAREFNRRKNKNTSQPDRQEVN